jgi:hypothetical protein
LVRATLGVGTGPLAPLWIAFSSTDTAGVRGFCVRSDDMIVGELRDCWLAS